MHVTIIFDVLESGALFHCAYFSVYVWLASLCAVNPFHATDLFPYPLKVFWC